MRAKSREKLNIGDLVAAKTTVKGNILVWRAIIGKKKYSIIGVAARDIKKGEIIEWNPLKNTKDILRKQLLMK